MVTVFQTANNVFHPGWQKNKTLKFENERQIIKFIREYILYMYILMSASMKKKNEFKTPADQKSNEFYFFPRIFTN